MAEYIEHKVEYNRHTARKVLRMFGMWKLSDNGIQILSLLRCEDGWG